MADSSSGSRWKVRRKFGIDIDSDTAMKTDEATIKNLLVEKARKEREWSKLNTNFESWVIGCLLLSELYSILNQITRLFWKSYFYHLLRNSSDTKKILSKRNSSK